MMLSICMMLMEMGEFHRFICRKNGYITLVC